MVALELPDMTYTRPDVFVLLPTVPLPNKARPDTPPVPVPEENSMPPVAAPVALTMDTAPDLATALLPLAMDSVPVVAEPAPVSTVTAPPAMVAALDRPADSWMPPPAVVFVLPTRRLTLPADTDVAAPDDRTSAPTDVL